VLITGALIAGSLLLDLDTLVKAASTVVLTSYVLSNLSVVTIRLGRVQNYRPSFRAPLFPYLQIVCAGLFIFLIIDLGLPGVVLSSVLLILALALYFAYGRQRNEQEYALLHLIERITSRQLTDDRLESELLEIIHDADDRKLDRFDRLVQHSTVLDIPGTPDSDHVFRMIADAVAPSLRLPPDDLFALLAERERESSTAISPFLAVPHIVLPGQGRFELAIARVTDGARFNADRCSVRALFALFGSKDERTFHLQALTAIAQIIQNPDFEARWLEARSPETLRHLILLANRRRH
jgi:mannitol/fructose-specific phosphotransferase system IIA component (Ntr-type)